MSTQVRLPTLLRQHAGGESSVQVDGSTIGQVLDNLIEEYPGIGAQVKAQDGSLNKFVNIYLNDEDVRYLDKLETSVPEGAVVSILPAVAGGLV